MTRAVVALLAVALAVVAIGACAGGGGSPDPQALIRDTFDSQRPIESGRLDLSFSLSASGSAALSEPVSLSLSGPFQGLGSGRLPRFALQLGLTTAGHTALAGVTSTGDRFYLELGGAWFAAPESTVTALRQGYAQATRAAGSTRSRSTFSSLGIDPGSWLTHPVRVGTVQEGGVASAHLVAGLNVQRFLADAAKLSGAGGALGLGGSAQGAGLLSPAEIPALASSVGAARVDVYTGAEDHVLRRLSLSASISTTPAARAALGGLRTGTLQLQLRFSDLGRPQSIAPPSATLPLSELTDALRHSGLAGAGSSAG